MDKLLSGRRVLVVEDEMLVLIMIEDMLADLGCESVAAAATVNQAFAVIDAQIFDVAMLDMNLNGCNSYAVAEAFGTRGVPSREIVPGGTKACASGGGRGLIGRSAVTFSTSVHGRRSRHRLAE
ncbi:response regulator [Mesorhizobium mediterraneum]|uniref:response regulator n=1 Tax=Mesorhizobium mediterraneum TaxID=43617 RepID=UPI00178631CD|nr:response regulator [Mesorhizobium mediterraneum]